MSAVNTSKVMLWTGRVLSTLIVLFMLMDGVMKLINDVVLQNARMPRGSGVERRPSAPLIEFCGKIFAQGRTRHMPAFGERRA